MKKWSAFAAVLLAGIGTFWYCWLIWKHAVEPALATWILFEVTVAISFLASAKDSKRKKGEADWVSNIGNTTDIVVVSLVLATLIVCGGTEQWRFETFDTLCLLASGAILLFRMITEKEVVAHLAIQFVMVAAYLPTMHKMWAAERITEAFGPWILQWVICALSLAAAIAGKNFLATVYSGRATTLVTILIGLMIRLKLKQG